MNFLRKYYRRYKNAFSPNKDDVIVLNTLILFAMFFPIQFLVLMVFLVISSIIDQILDNP